MTRDQAFQQYEEALDIITEEFNKAKAEAKLTLNANLRAIHAELHNELRVICDIQQKKGR